MIARIPVAVDTPFWRQRTSLDGRDFLLDFAWNERSLARQAEAPGRWYLSLYSVEEQPLALGMPLVCNVPLLSRRRTAAFPPGEIMVSDPTGRIIAPGFSDLNTLVQLVYFDAETMRGLGVGL